VIGAFHRVDEFGIGFASMGGFRCDWSGDWRGSRRRDHYRDRRTSAGRFRAMDSVSSYGQFTAMQVRGGKRAESPCICRGWKRPSFQAADRVARL